MNLSKYALVSWKLKETLKSMQNCTKTTRTTCTRTTLQSKKWVKKTHLNYASLWTSRENTVREQIEIKSNCFKYVSKKCYHLKSKNILSTIISNLEQENTVKPCIQKFLKKKLGLFFRYKNIRIPVVPSLIDEVPLEISNRDLHLFTTVYPLEKLMMNMVQAKSKEKYRKLERLNCLQLQQGIECYIRIDKCYFCAYLIGGY